METEKEFHNRLISFINAVLMFEDAQIQNLAIEHIPFDTLSAKASNKIIRDGAGKNEDSSFICELLRWFKFDFFKWVDAPKCEICNGKTERVGNAVPTPEEKYWGAERVEEYFCDNCKEKVRFPRYNHPRKLLETRRGRCGEWAKVFTLLCRSLGFDTRLVVDWGDHVWSEIYSESQKRWVHCDPCENVYDAPLMYEIGWKKKVSYVIAFSKDEVQDVTWRYCTNYDVVMRRRNLCREPWLLAVMTKITDQLQKYLTSEQKQELVLRKISELVEFFTPPKMSNDAEQVGRTSGSLAWRSARGECQPESVGHVFSLNRREVERKHFYLRYCCATDKYIRIFDSDPETVGWHTLTHYHRDICRKEEHDWNMVYLARKEGSSEGIISWKFNISDSGLVIDKIKMYIASQTFETGEVNIFFGTKNSIIPVKGLLINGIYEGSDLAGHQEFVVTVKLAGGKGDTSWQHAQLFRQSLDSNDYNFDIELFLT